MPSSSNDGANRGSVAHLVLECLLKGGKKLGKTTRLNAVRESLIKNPFSIYSVFKLAHKHAEKLGVSDDANMELICDFIKVALTNNFYLEDMELQEPEYEFTFGNLDEDGYAIRGFIDKHAICHKRKFIEIWDYKTSKAKFPKEELTNNLQALMYSLVMRKKYPDYNSNVNFLFLKFPRAPLQTVSFSADSVEGFEESLKYIYKIVENFDYEAGRSNLAASSKKNSWLCGRCNYEGELKEDGTAKWNCPVKFAKTYYALVDKNGDNVKTSYNYGELKETEDLRLVKKNYAGCPAFFS